MEFTYTPEQAAWRDTVRAFLAEHWRPADARVPDIMADQAGLFEGRHNEPWLQTLREQGWGLPAWPREHGGMGLGAVEQFIMREEFAEAGAPMPAAGVVAAALMMYGSEPQKQRYLPPMASGEERWCQGFSEPGAGSDLASLTTTAVHQGDDYIINGQKTWTSSAHQSTYMFALVRTDRDAPKHRGISMLIVDMKSPGLMIRPLINIAGVHHHNEVFFDDVRVPRENLIGEENRGWYQAAATLDVERSGIGSVIQIRQYFERGLRACRDRPMSSALRAEIAERWIELAVARLLGVRVVFLQADGLETTMPASIAKLFATELKQRVANTLMKRLGPAAMLFDGTGRPGAQNGIGALRIPSQYVNTTGATIGAGTSEIQRNVIATRGLGLPRS
jgi:alkylation response protein AidB-like acyl-CoA dehydrogenase